MCLPTSAGNSRWRFEVVNFCCLTYWADETAVRQDTAWVRGFAPAGSTSELRHRARWESITMISAITNLGQMSFALHDGAINTERFIDFLAALMADAQGRKVFLMVDNLRVHKAADVKTWLHSRAPQIELFYPSHYTQVPASLNCLA
jgi:hypothetical protein